MKCIDMSTTGVSLLIIGGTVIGFRQAWYKNDYSQTGSVISILASISFVAGISMYGMSTKPENCEGAGLF